MPKIEQNLMGIYSFTEEFHASLTRAAGVGFVRMLRKDVRRRWASVVVKRSTISELRFADDTLMAISAHICPAVFPAFPGSN